MDGTQDGSPALEAAPPPRAGVAGVRAALGTFLDAIEDANATAPREFTTLLALRPKPTRAHRGLLDRLEHLNDPTRSPLRATPGLHFARFAVLKNIELAPGIPFGSLVMYFRHDGEPEDFVYDLFECAGPVLDELLVHCTDYPGSRHIDASVQQLLQASVDVRAMSRTSRALGTLRRAWLRRGSAGSSVPAPARATDNVGSLDLDYGFALRHAFEYTIADERAWVEHAAALTRASARRSTRAARRVAANAIALRTVHAKHHGLVEATFAVRGDLPRELRHGMFQPNVRLRAWLRVSNMSARVQSDDAFDARGLAIKVEGVSPFGTPLALRAGEQPAARAECQDFMLANHPTFFVKDVRDYALLRALVARRDRATLALFGVRRLRELGILARALLKRVDHPLGIEYHSMTAVALGNERVVKYCVRPLLPLAAGTPPCVLGSRAPNHLRDALRSSLDTYTGAPLCLEFCAVLPNDGVRLSAEDGREDWSAHARCVPVATIEIERQDPCSEERMRRAEALEFSPWNTLDDHRPLGSLSRARLAVYRASAAERAALNHVSQV